MEIFTELAIVVSVATGIAFAMRALKQPLIVGYILAGILVGPYALNVLRSTHEIELFSKIGITVLLFIVGLNLSPKVIREVGKVSLVTGLGQVIFTSAIGFLIALILGIDRVAALYVSIALTFSSTIIILKLLSDRGDLDKLYGKISIGFLLVQDIVATLILLVVSSFSQTQGAGVVNIVVILLAKSLMLGIGLYIISGHIMPRVSRLAATSPELLFLFSMTWGLGLSALFHVLGFSVEIGALIAGATLSLTPFAYEIGSRLKPLRDFFIVLFFVLLGSQMVLDNVGSLLLPALVLSLFVLIGNPVIVIILMNLLGYKRKTGFMAGLTVAQISEFSLILAALGFNMGHLSKEILSLITLVGLVTIAGSTYLILYADALYPRLENFLKLLELKKQKKKERGAENEQYEFVLFGYDRVGDDFVRSFQALQKPYLVVDFNPSSIERLQKEGVPFRYGDAEDVEFLQELDFSRVRMVVSTIPDFKTNVLMVKHVIHENAHAIVIVLSHDIAHAEALYDAGATYVIMPHYLGARYGSQMIMRLGLDKQEFNEERERHLKHLAKRKEALDG